LRELLDDFTSEDDETEAIPYPEAYREKKPAAADDGSDTEGTSNDTCGDGEGDDDDDLIVSDY